MILFARRHIWITFYLTIYILTDRVKLWLIKEPWLASFSYEVLDLLVLFLNDFVIKRQVDLHCFYFTLRSSTGSMAIGWEKSPNRYLRLRYGNLLLVQVLLFFLHLILDLLDLLVLHGMVPWITRFKHLLISYNN